jgi:phosphohistidine phosphatase SixA
MSLFLIRHGKAGSRSTWDGDDFHRPLTASGRTQAKALAEVLGDYPLTQLLTSPYVRCVQTLEPLGDRLGMPVTVTQVLAEGMPFEEVVELVETVDDHAVLCTHGDVLQDVVQALQRRGMAIEGAPDWHKGVTWVLERATTDAGDVRVTKATVLPPPT